MASPKGEKLNRLQRILPEGLMVDAIWLDAHGYSKPLRDKYLASGWLERVSRGVYRRPWARLGNMPRDEGPLRWELLVVSLQNLLGYNVSVGGRTALDLHGLAHYLPAEGSEHEVHLYASSPLPSWLTTVPTNARWALHNAERLFEAKDDRLTHLSLTQLAWGHWRWPLTVSTPERAVLELLDELPNRESFDQADALFDGLGTLSPRRLQMLLEVCQSVKVKRLFFFFAERHNHAWFNQLDRTRINLGAGKRALVPNGRFDPKYQITVPDSLLKGPNGVF